MERNRCGLTAAPPCSCAAQGCLYLSPQSFLSVSKRVGAGQHQPTTQNWVKKVSSQECRAVLSNITQSLSEQLAVPLSLIEENYVQETVQEMKKQCLVSNN